MHPPLPGTNNIDTTSYDQARQHEDLNANTIPNDAEQNQLHDISSDQRHGSFTGSNRKRRRVTRACDECRRAKIKCDAEQPCNHCNIYSHNCTYNQPSRRRRVAVPQYVEALESQLKQAKALLSVVYPALDLDNLNVDPHLQSRTISQSYLEDQEAQARPSEKLLTSRSETPVKSKSQVCYDKERGLRDDDCSSHFRRQLQSGEALAPSLADVLPKVGCQSQSSTKGNPQSVNRLSAGSANALQPLIDMPPKKRARLLCDSALLDSGNLFQVVHIPTFKKSMDRIYDIPPEMYGPVENTFLPLFYAVLALGTLFTRETALCDSRHEASVEEGFKYFRACRRVLHMADCRDLTSLQATVFMIQFSLLRTRLSTCYAYIGVALRSALCMGMHRASFKPSNPIDAESRKRVFSAIRTMDTFVGTMLGLTIFIADEDVDQDWPTAVDDESITDTNIHSMPEGKFSAVAASNAHAKIIQLYKKICKYIYPLQGLQQYGEDSATRTVSYHKVAELEKDIQICLQELPSVLKPAKESTPTIMRVQYLLQIAIGHAQLLLYRPFLYNLSKTCTSSYASQSALAYAYKCVNVSRNMIHTASKMMERGLLFEADWCTMYSTFLAIVSVLDSLQGSTHDLTRCESFRDAVEGKGVLEYCAKRSAAAKRCTNTLDIIFRQLNERPMQGCESRRENAFPTTARCQEMSGSNMIGLYVA